MTTLTEFLLQRNVNEITEQVIVSERISQKVQTEHGDKIEPFKFTIKAITGDQYSEYQKQCTTIGKKGKVTFDSNKLNELLILNHTVDPDFRNAENIQQAGCHTPEQFMKKVLLAGEIAILAEKIAVLSGFDRELDDVVDDAKN